MIKDFELKGRTILSKKILGFGFLIELDPPYAMLKINWFLRIDLLWVRFWIESIKR